MSPEKYGRAVVDPPRPPRRPHPLVEWLLGRESRGRQREYALAGQRRA